MGRLLSAQMCSTSYTAWFINFQYAATLNMFSTETPHEMSNNKLIELFYILSYKATSRRTIAKGHVFYIAIVEQEKFDKKEKLRHCPRTI